MRGDIHYGRLELGYCCCIAQPTNRLAILDLLFAKKLWSANTIKLSSLT